MPDPDSWSGNFIRRIHKQHNSRLFTWASLDFGDVNFLYRIKRPPQNLHSAQARCPPVFACEPGGVRLRTSEQRNSTIDFTEDFSYGEALCTFSAQSGSGLTDAAVDLVYRTGRTIFRFRPLDYVTPPGLNRIDALVDRNFGAFNVYLYWKLNSQGQSLPARNHRIRDQGGRRRCGHVRRAGTDSQTLIPMERQALLRI